jgi:CheY-like chemotaxis protein
VTGRKKAAWHQFETGYCMIDKNIQINMAIVDDDYNDHYFMKKSLGEYPRINITSFFSGDQIVDYLNKTGEDKNSEDEFPQIILLDINMPRLSGFEVHEILSREEKFKNIHLAILSSGILEDFGACATLSCYQKPLAYEQYREVLEKIIEEWLIKKNANPSGKSG